MQDYPFPDNDDAAIEAALRAAPRATWTDLRGAAAEWHANRQPAATWPEMNPIDQAEDGSPIFAWPHPEYSDIVWRIVELLQQLGAVVVFDWGQADVPARYPGGAGLNDAPVGEAARVATTFVRAERFTDGAIESAVEQGYFGAVLDRVLAFADAEQL